MNNGLSTGSNDPALVQRLVGHLAASGKDTDGIFAAVSTAPSELSKIVAKRSPETRQAITSARNFGSIVEVIDALTAATNSDIKLTVQHGHNARKGLTQGQRLKPKGFTP